VSNPATLPAAAVVALLSGGNGLTAGTNLFACAELPPDATVPHKAVFAAEYGGLAPMPLIGVGRDIRSMSVQVMVRGEPDDTDGARTLAWAVWNSLQRTAPNGYIDCLCNQSGPVYLGKDDTEHPKFSVNLSLRYEG
jgi:hypothetical protein